MKIVTRALTVAEYKAKAALLGMWYGNKANVFVRRNDEGHNKEFFDADTGEEVSSREVARRIHQWRQDVGEIIKDKKGNWVNDL